MNEVGHTFPSEPRRRCPNHVLPNHCRRSYPSCLPRFHFLHRRHHPLHNGNRIMPFQYPIPAVHVDVYTLVDDVLPVRGRRLGVG